MTKDELVKKQLNLLKSIWRQRRGGTGYVFLTHIPIHKARAADRKTSMKQSRPYKLGEWDAISEYLAAHVKDELYFAPMVFNKPGRKREYATHCTRLWADLDAVDPTKIPDDLTPNILWETSPGRYAAVWFMVTGRPETTERGGENHRLTIALGADPSGWDTTQLLRVPLSANNKPGYPEGIRGKLVSIERGGHTWDDIDSLPELADVEVRGGDVFDEELLDSVNPYEAYARMRKLLPSRVRQMMRLKVADDTFDRSDIAWEIERSLADAGATLLEMVAIIRPTPWNKFEGRDDELKRLIMECGKALSLKKEEPQEQRLETDEDVQHDLVPFWLNERFLNAPDPEWLFEEFIPVGGCGFIAGIPKSMKSWLALDLAVCAAQGIDYMDHSIVAPVNVLYLQQEDPSTLVKSRLNTIATSKDASWSLDRPIRDLRPYPGQLFVEVYSGFKGNDEAWQTWLGEMVRRHDIKLVIFDTLATVAPGTDPDSGVTIKQELLDPIKEIAREYNCTMAFVHHNTKGQGNDRAGQNMTGSGQIHAWADFGIYIKDKTDSNVITFAHETKYTGSEELSYKLEGLEEEPQRYEPVVWVSSGPPPRPRKQGYKGKELLPDDLEGTNAPVGIRVNQYLRSHPSASNEEVMRATGAAKRTVTRIRQKHGGHTN